MHVKKRQIVLPEKRLNPKGAGLSQFIKQAGKRYAYRSNSLSFNQITPYGVLYLQRWKGGVLFCACNAWPASLAFLKCNNSCGLDLAIIGTGISLMILQWPALTVLFDPSRYPVPRGTIIGRYRHINETIPAEQQAIWKFWRTWFNIALFFAWARSATYIFRSDQSADNLRTGGQDIRCLNSPCACSIWG